MHVGRTINVWEDEDQPVAKIQFVAKPEGDSSYIEIVSDGGLVIDDAKHDRIYISDDHKTGFLKAIKKAEREGFFELSRNKGASAMTDL